MYEVVNPTLEILELLASDKTGAITTEDLARLVYSDQASVILVDGSTYVAVGVNRNELNVLAINGGGTKGWLNSVTKILNYLAIENNADTIAFMGRVGWKRKLDKFGYKQTGIIMKRKVKVGD